MSYYNFNQQLAVLLDESIELTERKWAFRACCASLSATTQMVVSTEEIILAIAKIFDAQTEKKEGKLLIATDLVIASKLLVSFRQHLIKVKSDYDQKRRKEKQEKRRCPVPQCFNKEMVMGLLYQSRFK